MKLELYQQIFEKYSDIRFNENPSSGAELLHADRQTNMMKLIVAFRNFANALKNQSVNAVKGNNRCLFSDPHKTHNLNYI